MKLTKRETFLLKLTGIVLLLALSYYFIISPQLDKLTSTKEQLDYKTTEVETVKVELESLPQLNAEIEAMQQSIAQSSQRYLPTIQQKKLILLMDEQLRVSNASADSVGFSQLFQVDNQAVENLDTNLVNNSPEGNGDNNATKEPIKLNVESMTIQAPLFGKYEEVMNFIRRLEELNPTTVINSLQLSQGTDGNISGSIGLDFYAMNKLTEDPQDDSYLDWPYNTPKGIDNPFPFVPTDSPETEEPLEGTQGEEEITEETEIPPTD